MATSMYICFMPIKNIHIKIRVCGTFILESCLEVKMCRKLHFAYNSFLSNMRSYTKLHQTLSVWKYIPKNISWVILKFHEKMSILFL